MPRSISAAVRWPCSARNAASSRCSTGGSARAWNCSASSAGGAECSAAADAWSSRVGQRPQLQVHVGGDVVRQPAQHLVDGARPRSGPATLRARPSARKPPAAAGTVRGMIGGTARSIATTCASRACACRRPPRTGSARRARSCLPRAATTPGRQPGGAAPARRARAPGSAAGSAVRAGRTTTPDPWCSPAVARSSSSRTTTAERASMTSNTAGTALRPTGLRSTAVMSMNARSPATPNATGPSIASTGLPVASPAQRGADHPERRQPHRRDRAGAAPGPSRALRWTRRPGRARRRHGVERGDRARLGEPQRAVAVEGPLDVLRRAEVRLDPAAQLDEVAHLPVDEAGRPRPAPWVITRPSVDQPVVGVDRAGDDGVAQPRRGVEHAAAAPAADRVGGEQHARGLCVDHPLHHHRELRARVRDARVGAVGHGPVRPERRPAAAHRVQHRVDADHVQVGVLLAREARAREVLGRGRRPHRDGHRVAERGVGVGDRGGDVVGDRRREQSVAGPRREVGGVRAARRSRRCRRPARTPGCPRRSRRAPGTPRRAAPRG